MNHPTLWGQSSSAAGKDSGHGADFCRVAADALPGLQKQGRPYSAGGMPGPRLRSATGQLLRLLLRLRQLADNRRAPRIPFRQPGQ
ncbi:Uncharacterised protein [Klebsiella pneumoniae]|uniref:Uncharacterized protein n=1 Tax=Klebsiella pneumoniae TaxID=573 RepID=A0A2X3EQX5_KLEPN|nr:Uncharacterised protein [Klebsiella pneumoniae]